MVEARDSRWSVSREAVRIAARAEEVAGDLSTLARRAERVQAPSGVQPDVAGAVVAFFEAHGRSIRSIDERVERVVLAARGACQAVYEGDEEQAATFHDAAVKASSMSRSWENS